MKLSQRRIRALVLATMVATPLLAIADIEEDNWINQLKTISEQQGQPLRPEAEARLRLQFQQMKMMQSRSGQQSGRASILGLMQGLGAQSAQVPTQAMPLAATQQNPGALTQQLQQFPPPAPADIVVRKDGFLLNNAVITDPAGRITKFSASPRTGDYTALVNRNDGTQWLKRGRGNAIPIQVAAIQGNFGNWSFQFADGQVMQVDSFALTPVGVIGIRDTTAFEWAAGQQTKTIGIPSGWSPVALQRGDIASSRHMLVERNADSKPASGSLGALFQSTKRLIGAESADDFALLNIDTGRLTVMAIDSSGKNMLRTSECRRKNAIANVCAQAQSYETLWQPDGTPNFRHYYWRVLWWDEARGPVAAALQDGVKEVRLFDLATGKEVVAFRSVLGYSSLPGKQTSTGQVVLGFKTKDPSTENGVDVRSILTSGTDMRGQTASGSYAMGLADGAPESTEKAANAGADSQ